MMKVNIWQQINDNDEYVHDYNSNDGDVMKQVIIERQKDWASK